MTQPFTDHKLQVTGFFVQFADFLATLKPINTITIILGKTRILTSYKPVTIPKIKSRILVSDKYYMTRH